MAIAKHRIGHYCPTAWIIIAIVVWEGVPGPAANHMYDYLTRTLPVYGYETERRCGTNQPYVQLIAFYSQYTSFPYPLDIHASHTP